MIAATLLTVSLAASPMTGLGPETVMQYAKDGLSHAKVGEWVQYKLDATGRQKSFLRLAVVGEQKDELGRPAYWLEMEFGDHPKLPAPLMQVAMLVSRKEGFTKAGVSKVFVGMITGRVQELAPGEIEKFLADWDKPSPVLKPPAGETNPAHVRRTRPTQLMTLAGTVTATSADMMYRDTIIQRIWVSEQLPLFKLVKIEMPAIGHTLEINDYGIDARPRIRLPGPDVPKLRLEAGAEVIASPAAAAEDPSDED